MLSAREARDLRFLGGELVPGLGSAFADTLAGGQQLAFGAPGERIEAHRVEHLERGAQLRAGVPATSPAPHPFAVEKVGAGQVDAERRAAQPFDRLAVETLR